MIVVSDTSPVLNLKAVNRLILLRDPYRQVVIPSAVQTELRRNGSRIDDSWMRVVSARSRDEVGVLRAFLDPGEAEAIVVAAEMNADLMLVDEKRGRRIAAARGLRVAGLLGVLAEAKVRGLIPSCGPVVDAMIEAGFWIGDDLRAKYLSGSE